ncbi:MAG: TraX family protein [Leptolyngbya sp. SIO4C1]|nr:TraX family protein [Leptolyngbya sp. SIO4C1]
MLIDHMGVVFFPDADWLRMVGRLSFPLFVWLLVQGEAHTRSAWRYGLRLLLLGIVSQPIYQYLFDIERLNILFQLLVGLSCLRLTRRWPQLALLIWPLGAGLAESLNISYGSYGIALVLLARYFQQTPIWWAAWTGFHWIWIWLMGPFQLLALPAPLLFGWANGRRGAKARWFYGFYPGHLALLAVLQPVGQYAAN